MYFTSYSIENVVEYLQHCILTTLTLKSVFCLLYLLTDVFTSIPNMYITSKIAVYVLKCRMNCFLLTLSKIWAKARRTKLKLLSQMLQRT